MASPLQAYGSPNDVEIGYTAATPSSWTTIKDALVGTYIGSSSSQTCKVRSDSNGASGLWWISRMFMYFDTSMLPDNAVITAARLELFHESNVSGSSIQPIYAVVGTFPAGPLSISNFGSMNRSQVLGNNNLSVVGVPRTLTIDPSGFQYINKIGFTKIVLITNNDFTGSQPSNGSTERSKTLSSQDNVDMSRRPLLTIDYVLSTPLASNLT